MDVIRLEVKLNKKLVTNTGQYVGLQLGLHDHISVSILSHCACV